MKAVHNHLVCNIKKTKTSRSNLSKVAVFHISCTKQARRPSNLLFPKCACEELQPRKWIEIGNEKFCSLCIYVCKHISMYTHNVIYINFMSEYANTYHCIVFVSVGTVAYDNSTPH